MGGVFEISSARVWKHTSLTVSRKIEIFQAVVVSKLLYGLSSAWLNKNDVRRLKGFGCRCLREVLRIKPSFVSRVSNESVIKEAQQVPLDKQLLKQQRLFYGKVARLPASSPLRKVTFSTGLLPATAHYIRRIGRPRNEWASMLHRHATLVSPRFEQLIHSKIEWRKAVHTYSTNELTVL